MLRANANSAAKVPVVICRLMLLPRFHPWVVRGHTLPGIHGRARLSCHRASIVRSPWLAFMVKSSGLALGSHYRLQTTRPWKWSRSPEHQKTSPKRAVFLVEACMGGTNSSQKLNHCHEASPGQRAGPTKRNQKERAARSRRSFMRNGSLPYLRSSSFRTRTSGRPSRCGPILPPISFMCAVLPCASKEA